MHVKEKGRFFQKLVVNSVTCTIIRSLKMEKAKMNMSKVYNDNTKIMSWIRDSSLSWPSLLLLRILKCGRIPQHIAFIMDGNRRFAKKVNIQKVKGHSKGFDKLSETLQWCLDIGVKEVTVYAFSIENYKRTKEEVDDLMNLSREKLKRLLEEKEVINEYGMKIRIIGNRSLLPQDITELMTEAEDMFKNNNKTILNIAFSYSAQDEITNAVNLSLRGLHEGSLNEEDLNVSLLSRCLYTADSPHPELVIRTSGETRLSDFLLWQSSCSYLHFTGVLWPEFSVWDFLWAIFKYQRVAEKLDELRNNLHPTGNFSPKAAQFLNKIQLGQLKNSIVPI